VIADAAHGCGERGNPETHYRLSRKKQELGQPSIPRHEAEGTMLEPMSYQDIRRAPEAARSLAFSILR